MLASDAPILAITDGTIWISLLEEYGFLLQDWSPARPAQRQVWQSSPLSDGRQLVDVRHENAGETFTIVNRNFDQDMLIERCQDADRLLLKASAYWTNPNQSTPVYLVARGPCETNTRYAVIHAYGLPSDANPYAQPFYSAFAVKSAPALTLSIERGHWQDTPPTTGIATAISAMQTYNGISFGRDAEDITGTSTYLYLLLESGFRILLEDGTGFILMEESTSLALVDEWYVTNHQKLANLTHVYWYDASGPAWSANLVNAARPFTLLPAIPATGDIVYFGCDTTVANSGPFSSLVFDILHEAVYVAPAVMAWEYWNGAWVALTVQDNTAGGNDFTHAFSRTGVNSVHWNHPSDWVTTAINGVTAYWVRARYTIAAGSVSVPDQRNRPIYSISWPRVDVDDLVVGGDLPAVARILFHPQSDYDVATVNTELYMNRLLLGLRSINRGGVACSSYTPYLNFADEQNPSGVTVAVEATDSSFVTDAIAPTGRRVLYNPGATRAIAEEAWFVLDYTIAQQYYGAFHAFLRCDQDGGAAGDIGCRLHVVVDSRSGTLGYYTDIKYTESLNAWGVLDFGRIVLPPAGIVAPDTVVQLYIVVEIVNGAAAASLKLFDLVLMPADEWLADVSENITATSTTGEPAVSQYVIDLDSQSDLRRNLLAYVKNASTMRVVTGYTPYSVGPAMLQANADQRLWFFMGRNATRTTIPRAYNQELSATIRLYRAQHYLSMRGSR
jgi:hypothetical protein